MKAVNTNPNILGGTPVFAGTRVPVRILFEHLQAGDTLAKFLADFPSVTHAQAVDVIEAAAKRVIGDGDGNGQIAA